MIILMEEYTLIKLQLYFFIFLLVKTTIILDFFFFYQIKFGYCAKSRSALISFKRELFNRYLKASLCRLYHIRRCHLNDVSVGLY